MGSFTEVCLSFDFAESTPDHVLAAFSALATGDESNGAPPTALPPPVVEAWEDFTPDWRDYLGPDANPYEHEPWRHDWARAVSYDMDASTTPHGLLNWSGYRWHLDCRFSWKTDPLVASAALEWLAPFVEPRLGSFIAGLKPGPPAEYDWKPNPTLVGYALYEGLPRPHLLWVKEGTWELEDLNPEDAWQ
ncbi:hypothetical protein [Nocardioides pelophilus]|uniref:hypothetical protein n=1 Tax=Nocardioides pelophilus TaxID=2172019 RepID=UPI0016004F3C|nr:hypothetical protein [Nocardioides pelophilus]